jgi:hypothetical protein
MGAAEAEPFFRFDDTSYLRVDGPVEIKLAPRESRCLNFQCGPGGPGLCPECGVHGVTEAFVISTFPGEPDSKCIGRKCLWCGWRGPCEATH